MQHAGKAQHVVPHSMGLDLLLLQELHMTGCMLQGRGGGRGGNNNDPQHDVTCSVSAGAAPDRVHASGTSATHLGAQHVYNLKLDSSGCVCCRSFT